jgi:hypothetical protein
VVKHVQQLIRPIGDLRACGFRQRSAQVFLCAHRVLSLHSARLPFFYDFSGLTPSESPGCNSIYLFQPRFCEVSRKIIVRSQRLVAVSNHPLPLSWRATSSAISLSRCSSSMNVRPNLLLHQQACLLHQFLDRPHVRQLAGQCELMNLWLGRPFLFPVEPGPCCEKRDGDGEDQAADPLKFSRDDFHAPVFLAQCPARRGKHTRCSMPKAADKCRSLTFQPPPRT